MTSGNSRRVYVIHRFVIHTYVRVHYIARELSHCMRLTKNRFDVRCNCRSTVNYADIVMNIIQYRRCSLLFLKIYFLLMFQLPYP